MDDSRIVLTRERYRIVAVTGDADGDRVVGYSILDAAGARLHDGLTLDDARARVEDFIRDEARERGPESVPKRPKPLGR